MEYIKIILEWLSAIGGGVVGIGGLAWIVAKLFGKNLLDFWFQKRLKRYEAELERKNREIQAGLDIQLEKIRIEHSILQAKRAEVTEQAYCMLIDCQIAVSRLLSPEKPKDWNKETLISDFDNTMDVFQIFWVRNKIYYSSNFANEVSNLAYKMVSTGNSYIRDRNDDDSVNYFNNSYNMERTNNIAKAVEVISNEFRKIIGVEN